MPIIPLYGHRPLRARLQEAFEDGRLPSSMLLHGPKGVGKQRLALWLGQLVLCADVDDRPCGKCQHCKFAANVVHPDLHWFFPRPRLKEADASPASIREDYAEAIAERVEAHGLYGPSDGTEGIFVATARALSQLAVLSPALATRKVFVVGDAERMVSQEGADQAANAFLKLLEEPPADTTIILTSSEPGALLPTIRSRVVAVRVPALSDADMRRFLADPIVAEMLADSEVPESEAERLRLAGGAPGALIGATRMRDALEQARRLVAAATSPDSAERYRLAFLQGSSRARGSFAAMLDALTVVLHRRLRDATAAGDARAEGLARAMEAVERAKTLVTGNVNPQLVTAALVRDLRRLVA